jgi:hypothetical protein
MLYGEDGLKQNIEGWTNEQTAKFLCDRYGLTSEIVGDEWKGTAAHAIVCLNIKGEAEI